MSLCPDLRFKTFCRDIHVPQRIHPDEVHVGGYERNISTNIGRITMKFGDIHVFLGINSNNSGDPFIFHLVS